MPKRKPIGDWRYFDDGVTLYLDDLRDLARIFQDAYKDFRMESPGYVYDSVDDLLSTGVPELTELTLQGHELSASDSRLYISVDIKDGRPGIWCSDVTNITGLGICAALAKVLARRPPPRPRVKPWDLKNHVYLRNWEEPKAEPTRLSFLERNRDQIALAVISAVVGATATAIFTAMLVLLRVL